MPGYARVCPGMPGPAGTYDSNSKIYFFCKGQKYGGSTVFTGEGALKYVEVLFQVLLFTHLLKKGVS